MLSALYISKMIDEIMDFVMTGVAIAIAFSFTADKLNDISSILSMIVVIFAGFFWTIRNKREIQQYHKNSIWEAIKSIFKKKSKYGDK